MGVSAVQTAQTFADPNSSLKQRLLSVGLLAASLDPEAGVAEGAGDVARAGEAAEQVAEGSFSIIDWTGYPSVGNVPRPSGPFRLLEGQEYKDARAAATAANKAMHQKDPSLAGLQIHEIQPVKFGGSPTDPANKIALPQAIHSQYTDWWNALQRSLGR